MKVRAIIQARMGSSRLPGKSLVPVAGEPLLHRVINSTISLDFVSDIIVATSNLKQDDPIEAYLNYLKVKCTRGSASDVLARYVQTSDDLAGDDQIVRITADNPFNWNVISKKLFEIHVLNKNDYTCVTGLSHVVCELVKVSALRTISSKNDITDKDKEHVTSYFRNNLNIYRVEQLASDFMGIDRKMDGLLTIDTENDRIRINQMIEDLGLNSIGHDRVKIYNWLSKQ